MINTPTDVKDSQKINRSTAISKKHMNLNIKQISSPRKHTPMNYSKLVLLLKDTLPKFK